MNLDPRHLLQGLIFFAFALFILYRRFRRNFGKQKLRPGYLVFRMVLLCVMGALLLIPTVFSQELAVVTLIGAAIGVGLAIWAAKHTRFLNQDGILYYVPHTYTGIVVTALFVGRLANRIFVIARPHAVVTTDWNPGVGDLSFLNAFAHNPVTRLAFFILIGYYVYYYWFVLHESRHLKPEDMEDGTPVAPTPKSGPGGNVS